MFSQLFGAFLLRREALTPEQLMAAFTACEGASLKIGTKALHCGFLASAQLDDLMEQSSQEGRPMEELVVDLGYLNAEQVAQLSGTTVPDYVLLGQVLIEEGLVSSTDLQALMVEYQNQTELYELELNAENLDSVNRLVEQFFTISNIPITPHSILYLQLLFTNLVRHIGDDFKPLVPTQCAEYATSYCVSQSLTGYIHCCTRLDMAPDVATEFASRYAGEDFAPGDEYITASIEDFINLHNGLFVVNTSNEHSIEISLDPPVPEMEQLLFFTENTYVIPLMYSFGRVNLLVSYSS